VQAGNGATYGPGRTRLIIVLAVFTVLAAAGAATGGGPARFVAAPVRFFFPSGSAKEAAASEVTTVPACRPTATLADRAAEVLVVGLPNVTEVTQPLVADVLDVGVGGVLVTGANVETRSQVTQLVAGIKSRARHPMVISTDEEFGRVSSFGSVIGYTSSARRLAREQTADTVRQMAREQATALASIGVTLDFAPVADLDGGPSDSTIGDRSFSVDPTVAARYADAYARGLADGGIKATAKHFPGRAQAIGDDHVGRITSSSTLADLQGADLKPFADIIGQGIPVVMVSNVDYSAIDPTTPASLSPRSYQLLRSLGFQGVAITDSVGMGAVNQRWDMAEAAVKAIGAGADAVLTTDGSFAKDMVHALVLAVQKGELHEDRLNQAAGRMIALAGGDPATFSCQSVQIPTLRAQP